MKKRINITISEELLKALDEELQRQGKERKTTVTRSWAIEDALVMWMNYYSDRRAGRFVQIGVDEDGMPVYGIKKED